MEGQGKEAIVTYSLDGFGKTWKELGQVVSCPKFEVLTH
jgi:hypothetical protein